MRSVPVHPAAALQEAELPLRQLLGGHSLHQRISFRIAFGLGFLIFIFIFFFPWIAIVLKTFLGEDG